MSLKRDFNELIAGLLPPSGTRKKPNEVTLFRHLIHALRQNGAIAEELHEKYVKYKRDPQTMRREICDVLLVLVKDNFVRFSFIQHKQQLKNSSYHGLSDFKGDCGQHFLLTERPSFSPYGRTKITPAVFDNKKYESITAYSVFYFDTANDYDLDYSCATSVRCSHGCHGCCARGWVCGRFAYGVTLHNTIPTTTKSRVLDEYLAIKDTNGFEQAIKEFLIGEKIVRDNAKAMLAVLEDYSDPEREDSELFKRLIANIRQIADDHRGEDERDRTNIDDLSINLFAPRLYIVDVTNLRIDEHNNEPGLLTR
jgi:hypothetical protein